MNKYIYEKSEVIFQEKNSYFALIEQVRRLRPILFIALAILGAFNVYGQSKSNCDHTVFYPVGTSEYLIQQRTCLLQECIWNAEYARAEELCSSTKALEKGIQDSLVLARYLLVEAEFFKIRQEINRATQNLTRAIRILEAENGTDELAEAKIGLAEFYRSSGQYDLSKLQLQQIVKLDSVSHKFTSNVMARAWHRLAAVAHEYDKDPSKTIEYSLISLQYSLPNNLLEHQATSYHEMGVAFSEMDKYNAALSNLEKALAIWRKLHRPHYEANCLLAISRLKSTTNPQQGLAMYDELLAKGEEYDIPSVTYLALREKGHLMYSLGEFKQGFVLVDSGHTLHTKLQETQFKEQLSELNAKYQHESAMKKLLAAELENLNVSEEVEKERSQGAMFLAGLVGALLIILILMVVYRRLVLQAKTFKKQQEIIERQNESLNESIAQKEALLQEVHHRVKNNLQFILTLVEMQVADKNAMDKDEALNDISRRISAIALVHERLYDQSDMDKVDVREYIKSIINSMNSIGPTMEQIVCIDLNIDRLRFSISRCIYLGMIISELITNSKKYAFSDTVEPRIAISLTGDNTNDIAYFVYEDNGSGYSEQSHIGLGTRLIDMFRRQLKGKFQMESNAGVSYKLSFPLYE